MKKFLITYKESRSITREVEAESADEAHWKFHEERDYQESDWEYWGEATEIDEINMFDFSHQSPEGTEVNEQERE